MDADVYKRVQLDPETVSRPKFAVLASGSGTTAEAVAQAIKAGELDAVMALIIHNNQTAGVVNQPTIVELGVPTVCINALTHPVAEEEIKPGEISDAESQAMLDTVNNSGAEAVIMLGYMKRVRGPLMETFGFNPEHHKVATDCRFLNNHPGPLPQTRGLYGGQVHERVYDLFKAGELDKTGFTMHAAAEDYDTGATWRYFDEVELTDADTPKTVEDRVRTLERQMTADGIQEFLREIS